MNPDRGQPDGVYVATNYAPPVRRPAVPLLVKLADLYGAHTNTSAFAG